MKAWLGDPTVWLVAGGALVAYSVYRKGRETADDSLRFAQSFPTPVSGLINYFTAPAEPDPQSGWLGISLPDWFNDFTGGGK